MPSSDAQVQPHRDAEAWPALIQGLSVEAILVLISTWMGPRLREVLSAEDLWQETLCMAWRDREQHEWQGPLAYRRWILGIARNRVREAVTRMRAQKRGGGKQPQLLSALRDSQDDRASVSDLLPPYSETPSRVLSLRERRQAMEKALVSLPGPYQEALRLRLFEQLSLGEVARRIGVSLATAKKRVYLGARLYEEALREALGRSPEERGPGGGA
ncbi:MAG TPA: sigma-70 family RNA polymerase sigma factor [Planctomycetes bacterium]|nr:sigma-70 family RNA polymerase sigma factor [Planctomycetota bacterium]